jgi:hypothetical protein
MQEVIVHPGTIAQAIASPGAEREIPSEKLAEVVLPSHSLSPAERVGVYHGMYLMRLQRSGAGVRSEPPVAQLHPEPTR